MLTYEHYSGGNPKCACCGELNYKFLSIDHVNQDGRESRMAIGGRNDFGGHLLARALRLAGWPSGFQILCMNCNMGRARNGGICPHVAPVKTMMEMVAEADAKRRLSRKSKSGLKGAYWNPIKRKWYSRFFFSFGRGSRHLGYFKNKEEAHAAYRSFVKEHK